MKVLNSRREKKKALSKKESKFKEHMPDVYLVKAEQLIVYDNFNNSYLPYSMLIPIIFHMKMP
ncbi:MAG: hypothetical protein Ct9H90mP22_6580 [Gammaproteobacteria bacterium]|nr:MAG: hypothetical protein Ct9H90mP22_6580 [Gammaproteobacteria bacterium]